MSNATETSHQSGESRRRNSRGGRNRSNQNQRRNQGGSNRNRSDDGPPPRGSRRGRPPVKLSWWQKLLKAVGLYKAPIPAKGRKSDPKSESDPKSKSGQGPKSNTRIARSSEGRPEKSRKRDDSRNTRSRGGDPSTVESARVYVGNLSYDVAEQDLQELFKGVGTVRSTEIVYNRSTHRSKGYGFVEMIHVEDAVRAVEVLHDQPFMGRNMIVSGAKSKQDEANEQEEEATEIRADQVELAPLPEDKPLEAEIQTVEEIPTAADDEEKVS